MKVIPFEKKNPNTNHHRNSESFHFKCHYKPSANH